MDEGDIDDFIDAEMYRINVALVRVCLMITENGEEIPADSDPLVLDAGSAYSEDSENIARFLVTLQRSDGMEREEFRKFRDRALKFHVSEKQLFKRTSKNSPLRRVVDSVQMQEDILKSARDDVGYKGRESTYRRIADKYWWEFLWKDFEVYVRNYRECQFREPSREEEALCPTWQSMLWAKAAVDVMHMPPDYGKSNLVVAREDLSGWVEARALTSAISEAVARFSYEDAICRHGCFGTLVVDGRPENKDLVTFLSARYNIKRLVVSAYHPQANGIVERGHRLIVDGLAKLIEGGLVSWLSNLHTVLWADRTGIRTPTGMTPFRLMYRHDAVLPIELDVPTWQILDWNSVKTTADLLAMQARQLQRRNEDLEEAK